MPHSTVMIYSHLVNAAGSDDMAVDGSSTPVRFFYKCPTGYRAFLYRSLIQILDAGIVHTTYGGITALTNGISIDIIGDADTSIKDLTGGHAVKTNADWRALCYDADIVTKGALDNMTLRWTFSKDAGAPIILEAGDAFTMTVNDNLSNIDKHHALIRGYLRKV